MVNPLIPMLAITGKPAKKDIENAVSRFHECGFEQLMLYPRDGCELSYMTDEWFDAIGAFLDAGKQYNMSFWLYDEYNYPSGGCRGAVMAKSPDFCLKYLKAKIENGHCEPQFITNEKYPDILNPDAVDFFIESTHQQYKNHFGEYFGREIKGIFTDEPSFYYGVWEADELPFYSELPSEYQTLTGRDFYGDYGKFYSHAGAEDFLPNCYKLLTARMKSSFTKHISDWCRENGIYMTGHLMADDYPGESTRANGNLLTQMAELSLPCIDDIFSVSTKPRLQMSLSAIQYASQDKDGAGAELFALGPCDISFAKMRMMIWYTALFGVSNYFLAISHLGARGNAQRKFYFNNYSPDNPCAFAYRQFGEDAKRAAETAKKPYSPDVYLRFPCHLTADDLVGEKNADRLYEDILTELRKNQVQYQLVSDEAVLGCSVIELTHRGYTLDGKEYSAASSVAAALRAEQVYTLPDGTLSEDIMVRKYADGTTVLLNLTDKAVDLVRGDERLALAPYGLKVAGEEVTEYTYASEKLLGELVYEGENVAALTVTDQAGVCEFDVADTVSVRFALRAYPGEIEALLDGEKLKTTEPASVLPQCFEELYKQTDEVTLSAGRHTVSVVGGIEKFYKYLPEVFLTGDFYKRDGVLSPVRFDGKTPERYGKYSCTAELDLPADADVEIVGTDKPLTLTVDGVSLGTRIAPPYVWQIPAELSGKAVTVKVNSASDMSPAFGNTPLLEELDGTSAWCRGYCPEFEREEPQMKIKVLKKER